MVELLGMVLLRQLPTLLNLYFAFLASLRLVLFVEFHQEVKCVLPVICFNLFLPDKF